MAPRRWSTAHATIATRRAERECRGGGLPPREPEEPTIAFIVTYGRVRLGSDACRALVDDWRAVRAGRTEAVRRAALDRLAERPPERLAIFGLADDGYARGWLEAEPIAAGMAFSLLLLDAIEPIAAPDPGLWQAMRDGEPTLGLPAGLVRRAASGHPLVRWLDRLAGTRASPLLPPDSHLGGWRPAQSLLRLAPLLRPAGRDPRHDALRVMLADLGRGDWVVMTTIW